MGFSCLCDDGPEFFREQWAVARKPHTCCECREIIQPGDRYCAVAGKWEGEFSTFATCERCQDLRDSYVELGYCYTFGTLWSDHLDMLEMDGKSETPAYAKAKAIRDRARMISKQRIAERQKALEVAP